MSKTEAGPWENVPSPFCGIGTDDLTIAVDGLTVTVESNGCAVNTPAFEQPVAETEPQINGQPATRQAAIERAAELLRDSNQPIIGGLATDVHGMRAALSLGDATGAVIDSMNSPAAMRNLLALQSAGWMNTTLAEVKNRVDLLLVVGTDIEPLFPRFFERYIWNSESMFGDDTAKREVIFLGKAPSGDASTSPSGRAAQILACADDDLPEVMATLRALYNGKMIRAQKVGGIPVESLRILAKKLREASYSVVTWAAGSLAMDHADLTVQMLCDLVKDVNETTRASGLPLGGKEGDMTAALVSGWISGYPMRFSYASGHPEYDPHLNSTDRLLASGEADALLWISAYNCGRTPPACTVPTIVLGRSGMTFEQPPEVYIPIGTPGIDHSGHIHRMDNVVALRLLKLRDSGLPSSAEILSAIEQAL